MSAAENVPPPLMKKSKSATTKVYNDVCAELDNDSRMVVLTHKHNGAIVGRYPFVWLRDNCRCSACYHPSSRSRLFLITNLDLDIVPSSAEVVTNLPDDEETLQIRWSADDCIKDDGHMMSSFPVSWLVEHQFSNMSVDHVSKPKRHLWGNEMQSKIPSFSFSSLLNSDKALHDWIESLQVYGLALVKEAPQKEGALLEIGKRVSHLKTTNYG